MAKELRHASTSEDADVLGARAGDQTALERTVQLHSVELDRHADLLHEINDRTKRLERTAREHTTKLERLETTTGEHTTKLDQLATRLDQLQTAVSDHSTKLDRLETAVTDHSTKLDRLETAVTDHSTKLDRLEAITTEHTAKLAQLRETIDGVVVAQSNQTVMLQAMLHHLGVAKPSPLTPAGEG